MFKALWELDRPACDFQIAKYLLWPINCVTPRRGELVELGFVEKDYEAPGPPVGNTVTYWRILEARPGSRLWREKIRQAKKHRSRAAEGQRGRVNAIRHTNNEIRIMSVSQAGRTLREYQKVSRRKQTRPTAQMMLFA